LHATTVHTHHEYEKDTDQYPDAVGLQKCYHDLSSFKTLWSSDSIVCPVPFPFLL
jgi:hypothetical protein